MLQTNPTFDIRIEAENGNDLLDQLSRQKVDVVITDISMPEMDGEEVARTLSRDHKDIKVIALSMHDDLFHIKRMIDAGVKGYVLKSANPPELLMSVSQVKMGKMYFCSGTMSTLVKEVMSDAERNANALTEREAKVLRMIYDEVSEQDMADQLGVATKTIQHDKKELFRKTGAQSVVGLVKWLLKNGV